MDRAVAGQTVNRGSAMRRLEDRVVIVTGGAKGLGRAFCLRMAAEGAKIVVADILEERAQGTAGEIVSEGGKALALEVDVASETDTIRMVDQALSSFGTIDVLVNNAGMLDGLTREPFTQVPLSEWDKVMEVNVKGTMLCCRAVFPELVQRRKGKIVNISSDAFHLGPVNSSHYSTSKGAVIALTRCLASEFAPYNVCVNSVAPGVVDTESTQKLTELREIIIARTPLGRLAKPEDIAGAVVFFASDDSNHITGQTLVVDGGIVMQ